MVVYYAWKSNNYTYNSVNCWLLIIGVIGIWISGSYFYCEERGNCLSWKIFSTLIHFSSESSVYLALFWNDLYIHHVHSVLLHSHLYSTPTILITMHHRFSKAFKFSFKYGIHNTNLLWSILFMMTSSSWHILAIFYPISWKCNPVLSQLPSHFWTVLASQWKQL